MIGPEIKSSFSRFLSADPDRLHLAAHSHHFWPDVSARAHEACWNDAARFADDKWDVIFGEIIPAVQRGIAGMLGLPDPAAIAFAPNTHEFLLRILSGLLTTRPRILSTDSEFHSFRRQATRLAEEGVTLECVATEPFDSFAERFIAAAQEHRPDLIYLSQVFFNSGFANLDLSALVHALPAECPVVIDGYHGYMAIPTNLSGIADRCFYLAGGYKYAMAGEGACFCHVPPGWIPRPTNTGWYAEMAALAEAASEKVAYASNGSRFLGSTFDPAGLYRMRAVLQWFSDEGLSVAATHTYVRERQKQFVAGLEGTGLSTDALVVASDDPRHGNFLTFRMADAAEWRKRLSAANVMVDSRGDRLRFGFAIYHDEEDIDELLKRIKQQSN